MRRLVVKTAELPSTIKEMAIEVSMLWMEIPICKALLWQIMQLHYLYCPLLLGCKVYKRLAAVHRKIAANN